MPNSPNAFVWHELMTTDLNAAEAFYGAVISWGRQAWGEPGTPYTAGHQRRCLAGWIGQTCEIMEDGQVCINIGLYRLHRAL